MPPPHQHRLHGPRARAGSLPALPASPSAVGTRLGQLKHGLCGEKAWQLNAWQPAMLPPWLQSQE